jgi:hypothetical protein
MRRLAKSFEDERLEEKCRKVLGLRQVQQQDICHRRAAADAALLINALSLDEYEVRLVHFTSQSAVAVSRRGSGASLGIVTGFLRSDFGLEQEKGGLFVWFSTEHPGTLFTDSSVDCVRSRPLMSVGEAFGAMVESFEQARCLPDFYPDE